LMSILGEDLNASAYRHFRRNKVDILNDSVLPGTIKGKRLDRWIVDKENRKLYQCEIKNWAATAIGGRHLRSDASDEDAKKVVEYHWSRELSSNLSRKAEHPNGVTKVLLQMKPPEKYRNIRKTEPLLIFWMPISSDRRVLNPLSDLSVKSLHLPIKTKFSKLHVFSVSLYLRQLYKKGKGQKFIDLEIPHFEHRMKILAKFRKRT
ncbi:MAG: hypothetical protein Q7S50_01160, partial [bacterium]|nr:hypothetical protein [bacterium]